MGSETSPSLRCKQHIYFMGSETSPSLRIYFMGSETSPSLRFTLWGRKRLLHCVANFDLNQYTLSKGIQIFDLRTKVGLCKGINISYTSHRYDLGYKNIEAIICFIYERFELPLNMRSLVINISKLAKKSNFLYLKSVFTILKVNSWTSKTIKIIVTKVEIKCRTISRTEIKLRYKN